MSGDINAVPNVRLCPNYAVKFFIKRTCENDKPIWLGTIALTKQVVCGTRLDRSSLGTGNLY